MFEYADSLTTVVVATVAFVVLLGVGGFVGVLAGRRSSPNPLPAPARVEWRTPQHLLDELASCIELGDCITQDADSLIAVAGADLSSLPPDANQAMQQLIKTAKSLAGKLQHVAETEALNVNT